MTLLTTLGGTAPSHNLIEEAIAQHGAMRVLMSAVHAMITARHFRRERPPDVSRLDARMRRDIGLLPDINISDWSSLY